MSHTFDFDLILKNGTIVTASDEVECEVGCKDGKVLMLGLNLPVPEGCKVIDVAGGYITPGGVDSHVHIDQTASKGRGARSSDNWNTGTRSALGGGTTTVVAFAVQSSEGSLTCAVDQYHELATGNANCDYGFHVIVNNPSENAMHKELPALVANGITSVKIYSTYPALKLDDGQILAVMYAARQYGITLMIHAENSDMIDFMTRSLERQGKTDPWHHGTSRPPIVEAEATHRAVALSELMDCPVLFVHCSVPEAWKTIRDAQGRGMSVYGETCPHYLTLDASEMKGRGFEGAKACCAPPLREDPEDKNKLWGVVENGTVTLVSSDHAPTNWDDPKGKQLGLTQDPNKSASGNFRFIPNGLPGVETRAPLMWSEGVCKGRISKSRFVELNSTAHAKLYGMYPRKGTIQPGSDADFIIWRAEKDRKQVVIEVKNLHSGCDYTPYEGKVLEDWPRMTILRGQVVFDDADSTVLDNLKPAGKFLKRGKSVLPGPRKKWVNEWRPDYVAEDE